MKAYILILLLLLSGCATTCEDKIVKIEVYTPPKVNMPHRPVLVSKGGTVDDITRSAEQDLIDLEVYATELENIISKVFKIDK